MKLTSIFETAKNAVMTSPLVTNRAANCAAGAGVSLVSAATMFAGMTNHDAVIGLTGLAIGAIGAGLLDAGQRHRHPQ